MTNHAHSTKLKIIVIGLGHQSLDDHIPAISESERFELVGVVEQQKAELQRSEGDLRKLIPDLRKEIEELRTQARILNDRAREVEKTVSVIAGMGTTATRLGPGYSYRAEPGHTRENCPDTAVGGCIHHADSC